MVASVEDLTITYEENGVVLTKEIDKNILTKGAWTTILFRYQNWENTNQTYGSDRYMLCRYQKRNDAYILKSKFNISSQGQAKKIVEGLQMWIEEA